MFLVNRRIRNEGTDGTIYVVSFVGFHSVKKQVFYEEKRFKCTRYSRL